MNNRYLIRGIVIAVLAIAAAVAIGLGAYNAGVAQGIAESGRVVAAAPPAGTPYVYVWPRHYWGFGFGFFPLFFLLFFFFAMRALFWRRSWRGGWGGGWGCGYGYGPGPYNLDEWHRRAHEQPGSSQSTPPTTA
jgi:hypothetical protein